MIRLARAKADTNCTNMFNSAAIAGKLLFREIRISFRPIPPGIWLLFAMAAFSCTNDMRDVMSIPRNKLSASQVGDSVTMLYTDSAKLKVMLKTNRMLLFNKNVAEPFTVLTNGVYVTFFDEDERVSARLKAKYGVRYDQSRKMEAKFQVVVINTKGDKLETEKLIWDEYRKKIYTDAFVKITTSKEIIMGNGMESNQDFTRYRIRKVTGQIQLKQNEI
jgi:LPS export ABC transporter protein LptC